MEKFWLHNPKVLLDEYYIILPTNDMSTIQILNTLTRFFIYYTILCIIFGSTSEMMFVGIIGIVFIIIYYNIYISDSIGIKNDLMAESNKQIENLKIAKYDNSQDENFNLNEPAVNIYDSVKDQVFKGGFLKSKDVSVESGYIDSDGNYRIGPNYSEINYKDYEKQYRKNKKKKVSWEKDKIYKNANCRKPTAENPFANIIFTDYLDAKNLPVPCNSDDGDVPQQMQQLYNSTIYRNLSDVFERENSQRVFMTMPIQTVPNDQTDFANWLYNSPTTCHENTGSCTYYEDPRMSSPRY